MYSEVKLSEERNANMNWDAIVSIAELLGAIGVIGSLVYLAGQVNSAARSSKVDAKLRTTEFLVNFQSVLIEKPELNALMMKGRKGIDKLTKEEFFQFSNLVQKAFWYFSACYFQKRLNTIEEEDWYEVLAIIRYWTTSEGAYQWWKKIGHKSFNGKFSRFIELEFERSSGERPDQ